MRVLIATGGPGQTEIGLRQLTLLAETMPLEPTVLTVIKHAEEQPEADQVLAHAATLMNPVFGQVRYQTRIGQPWEEIVAEGETGKYDLLMMGQRQSRPLLTRIRGLVTQKVVAHTSLPVLIAKREARPLRRVLICDSGVQSPSLLQRLRDRLPDLLAAVTDVTVLHVMSQVPLSDKAYLPDLAATADDLMARQTREGVHLQSALDKLREIAPDSPHAVKVRHGFVVDEILAELREGHYDLLVVGAHIAHGLNRWLLDDVTAHLLEEAATPVLVVRGA